MIKLLTWGILFATAVRVVVVVVVAKIVILGILLFNHIYFILRAELVAKLVILGISPLTTFILGSRVTLVAKLVISSISSSISLILALYSVFLTSFLLHHLVFLNRQEQVLIYQHLVDLLYFSNCLNHLVHFLIYHI